MRQNNPIVKDVVLLGGGHAHVIVIRKWGMQPIPGVRLTLVSEDSLTPYSGMLPGLIAGHYSVTQSNIDLARLCQWAGTRFVVDRALGVDANTNIIQFEQRPDIGFDYLSIDTGGAPRLDNVSGARQFTIPVKPVHQFYHRWQQIQQRAMTSERSLKIAVVGAGAGGFEILMAMHHGLQREVGDDDHEFHWIIRDHALVDFPDRVKRIALANCLRKNIQCHNGFSVIRVESGMLHSASGQRLEVDEILWCTEAQAPDWPVKSGLRCQKDGFIEINDSLQSISHSNVFAAGDVAVQINHPRPRAGVFAVRQGPVLFENLQKACLGKSLGIHRPQNKFLTILTFGDQSAIACKGRISVNGKWVWNWKHWIDQRFMDRFNKLPPMPLMKPGALPDSLISEPERLDHQSTMRCGGCGAKIPGDVLSRVIDNISVVERPDMIAGLSTRDDVAVIDPSNRLLAQSVDQIRSMVDDPWIFGRIATIHALSDLYAAGAIPQSAMVLAGLPHASDKVIERDLGQIMNGIAWELNAANCALSGGHTSESAELSIGMVVNGYPQAGAGIPNTLEAANATEQVVIITKAIGIGVVMAANMRAEADSETVQHGINTMLLSNAQASEILLRHGVTAMTDVTGFGIAGHLTEMLSTGASCRVELSQIPVLPGARILSNKGIKSSLFIANFRYVEKFSVVDQVRSNWKFPLLFDPQTSGGLLGILPKNRAMDCLTQLTRSGYCDACVIGQILDLEKQSIMIENNDKQI